jgi:hypothetical protein
MVSSSGLVTIIYAKKGFKNITLIKFKGGELWPRKMMLIRR